MITMVVKFAITCEFSAKTSLPVKLIALDSLVLVPITAMLTLTKDSLTEK